MDASGVRRTLAGLGAVLTLALACSSESGGAAGASGTGGTTAFDPTCPVAQVRCDDVCVSLTSSAANCGACNNSCSPAQSCDAGACVCPAALTSCENSCVDTSSNPANCGTCNNACGTRETCNAGACECEAGRTGCDGSCVDLRTDPANCGECSTICARNEVCNTGKCTTGGCGALTQCGQSCVDLQSDEDHCGLCENACPQGKLCETGSCGCPSNQLECGDSCIDSLTNIEHCGNCDSPCAGGQVCKSGTCACENGGTLCDGSGCVDTDTNASHCGDCKTSCGAGETCDAGKCTPGGSGGSGGGTGGTGGSGGTGGTNTGDCVQSGELRLWHKVSFTCVGPQTDEQANPNPFRDYRMTVTFTKGSNTLVVPGHFAADGNAANSGATSGNLWRVHFLPIETGSWTYTVSFREGSDVISGAANAGSPVAGIDGASGSFTVSDTNKTGRDMRAKGLLKYVGGHHLRFAGTGEYFLKQGPDSPENFLAYEDFDGDFKSDGVSDNRIKSWSAHVGDWTSGDPTWGSDKGKAIIGAINYLASKGLNSFSFIPMNVNGDDKNCFPYTDYDERYRIDVSKMDQWETVFAHGTNKGFFLHFKTLETENETLLDNGNMGTQRRLYYRELISRFAHHPALNWNLGEEINDASTSQKSAWASYFWNNDPYQHHIVIHNGDNHQDLMGPDHKLTGFSLQVFQDDYADVHGRILDYLKRSAAAGKPWAVACDESGSASHGLRPAGDQGNSWEDGRKNGLWGSLLAGGSGNEWYFGYDHDHSDVTCEDFRTRDGFWNYARYALNFFNDNAIPFWQMKNDDNLSSASSDYCFYKKDDTYVVYLKNGGQTNLNLSGATGTFQVRWFDPRNGGNLTNGSVTSVSGGGNRNLGNPPNNSSADWVVLVRK